MASNRDIDENDEVNPLKDIIYNRKNRSNQPNQPNQLDQYNRTNTSFHLRPHVANAIRKYSRFTDKTVGECVEAAFIEYMQNHPVDQVSLSVTSDIRSILPTLKSRMKHKIVRKQLEDTLKVTIRLHQKGNDYDIRTHYSTFRKAVEKALRVKKPDEDLLNILRRCEDYL